MAGLRSQKARQGLVDLAELERLTIRSETGDDLRVGAVEDGDAGLSSEPDQFPHLASERDLDRVDVEHHDLF